MDKASKEPGGNGRDRKGRFQRGHRYSRGRPAGRGNLLPAELKADIGEAYRRKGGIRWLESLPDPIFARLLERVIPKQLEADLTAKGTGPPQLSITVIDQLQQAFLAEGARPWHPTVARLVSDHVPLPKDEQAGKG